MENAWVLILSLTRVQHHGPDMGTDPSVIPASRADATAYPDPDMPDQTLFESTFNQRRGLLEAYSETLNAEVDLPGNYQLSSRVMKARAGRSMFVAAPQIMKTM